MAFDSLKSGVSDYKDKKADLIKQNHELAIEAEKADDLISYGANLDDSVQESLLNVRDSLTDWETELAEASDQLDHQKLELEKLIKSEQDKLSAVHKQIDSIAGKKYTGGLDAVSEKCDNLMAALEDMLADLDEDNGAGSSVDSSTRSNSIVKIDNDYYRVDDNGTPHMKRGNDKEYHVLPNTRYTVNGYTYQSDDLGRIIHAEGNLEVKNGERASLNAKVSDMGANDQRGHLIADLFGGSNQNDNLLAQLQPINQGAYKVLEGHLADLIGSQNQVYGDYSVDYQDNSARPSAITVSYSVNGGMPISQMDAFSKLGLQDSDSFGQFEQNLQALHNRGHTVNCNYRVVFSNDYNCCWLFVEHTVDDGFPVLTQFM